MKKTHTHELIDEAIEDAAYWKGQAQNVPELLAALTAMMNLYGDKSPHPTCDASISARAAIAKAEGVQ
jgi:hypothetical protein